MSANVPGPDRIPPARILRTTLRWGARLGLVALLAWFGSALHLPFGPLADVAVGIALGVALLGLGALTRSLLGWIVNDWARVLGSTVLAATFGAAALLIGFNALAPLLALTVWALWLGIGVGLAAPIVLAVTWRRGGLPASRDRTWLVAVAAGSLLAGGALAGWWWAPGGGDPVPPLVRGAAPALALADPGQGGPYAVASATYGSGAPAWRAEYGADASVRTTAVDLSDLSDLGGFVRTARRAALGFDLDAVPRNATVWYPATGDGPFPLVLVAHGNANLFLPSDLGYAWLGAHLASHGFVVASIDAAAFNALPLVGGLRGEMDGRALLMLAHLDLWRGWAADGDPRLPHVDLGRIALIGHSRGGEAAASAATLDRLGRLPADATELLSERVGGPHAVRAVVALAPSDGQFEPGDRPTQLEGVDYLVVQGGYDADVSSFFGERQYERTRPAEDGFRAAVYLHHANHVHFNQAWGPRDLPPPLSALLRTGPVMSASDQQRAGAVWITAFLRASLLAEDGYRDAFRDPRGAADWLPATAVVTRYRAGDAGLTLLDFAEDVDPSSGSLPGSTVTTTGLALWSEGDPGYRRGVARRANAVTLGWRDAAEEPPAAYSLQLPTSLAALAPDPSTRWLTLEVARSSTPLPGQPSPSVGALDASVVVRDEAGETARLPLSAGVGVPPYLPSRVARVAALTNQRYRPAAYPLIQRIDLPLAALLATNPALDWGKAFEVGLEFDRQPEGVLVLRSLALTPVESPR